MSHLATSDLCHNLVLWAWSRRAEHIVFVEDTEACILEAANEMSDRYSDCIPLIEGMSLRLKIARIAVAMAIRLFSTDDNERVLVTWEHAMAAKELMCRIYDAPNFALDVYAEQYKKDNEFNLSEIEQKLESALGIGWQTFTELFHNASAYRLGDLEALMGWNKPERKDAITELIKARLVKTGGNGIQRTPKLKKFAFEWLKEKKP